jgi:hypothetical protein
MELPAELVLKPVEEAVVLVLLVSCRILQTLESKQRGSLGRARRVSFSSWIHLLQTDDYIKKTHVSCHG